jgi:hypothetical protein
MLLLNPHKLTREYPDEKSAEIMRKTVEFFEAKGLAKIKEHDRDHLWYSDFLDLGHLAQLRIQRDPGFLRPVLLVHVAGIDPWARPDLDEPA